jgi:hypothetical protein
VRDTLQSLLLVLKHREFARSLVEYKQPASTGYRDQIRQSYPDLDLMDDLARESIHD